MSILPGQKLGNYQVLSKIGTGGMGAVYLAEHPLIGKKVALKVIHSDLAARPDVMARFSNEARAVGQIAGEHVVQIHDFGQAEDGSCFFVMEYLRGHTLARELAGGSAISVARALFISAQLAKALAAVHSQSLLHRDLKPDNVMLVERNGTADFVVLLDFGLVKFLGGDGGSPQLTTKGMLLGTPQYMSPEACEGKLALDHRADQYALGILAFQMLTGRLPFDGESTAAILMQQIGQPPPSLRRLNGAIPAEVEQIVLKCLAKDRDQRFADMDELREALLAPAGFSLVAPAAPDPVRRPSLQTASTPRRSWPGRLAALATVIVVVTIVALVWPGANAGRGAGGGRLDGGVPAGASQVPDTVDARTTIRLRVVTNPEGAEVLTEAGDSLGTTPLDREVDRVEGQRALRLRHPRAAEKVKTFDGSRDIAIDIDLAPSPAARPPKRPPRKLKPQEPSRANDVLRPSL